MGSDPDAARLSSAKTEILIAFIFSIIFILVWLWYFIDYVFLLGILSASTCVYGYCVSNPLEGTFIAYGIVFLILMIPSVLVLLRTNRMRSAADSNDKATLKALNSMGWAIVALIFAGVIPGIMLLVANGPISELGTGAPRTGGSMMATQPAAATTSPPATGGGQFCPSCGTQNPLDYAYCRKCGAKLG